MKRFEKVSIFRPTKLRLAIPRLLLHQKLSYFESSKIPQTFGNKIFSINKIFSEFWSEIVSAYEFYRINHVFVFHRVNMVRERKAIMTRTMRNITMMRFATRLTLLILFQSIQSWECFIVFFILIFLYYFKIIGTSSQKGWTRWRRRIWWSSRR